MRRQAGAGDLGILPGHRFLVATDLLLVAQQAPAHRAVVSVDDGIHKCAAVAGLDDARLIVEATPANGIPLENEGQRSLRSVRSLAMFEAVARAVAAPGDQLDDLLLQPQELPEISEARYVARRRDAILRGQARSIRAGDDGPGKRQDPTRSAPGKQ